MSAGCAFTINKAYADYALNNRSMFLRHYYILLLYFSITPPEQVPPELHEAQQDLGTASFDDLVFVLSWRTAKKTMQSSIDNLKAAFIRTDIRSDSFKGILNTVFIQIPILLFRLLCVPCCLIGTIIMLPVNAVYGILDWISLHAAKFYFTNYQLDRSLEHRLEVASYIAFASSLLTIAFRLAAGFVEALQEPLHLYDFWCKGWVDAGIAYEDGEISMTVLIAKRFLHSFKVFCTLGAILSIAGIVAIPIVSKIFEFFAKVPHYMISIKNLIPFNEYVLDAPTHALRQTIISVETLIKHVTGLHYSHVSQLTHTSEATDLGYESALTKFAAMLFYLFGYRPTDIKRREDAPETRPESLFSKCKAFFSYPFRDHRTDTKKGYIELEAEQPGMKLKGKQGTPAAERYYHDETNTLVAYYRARKKSSPYNNLMLLPQKSAERPQPDSLRLRL